MRRTVQSLRLEVPPDRAFAACLRLLTDADPRRGMLARRCEPDPPVKGSLIITTVRSRDGGERELRASVVALDPPREIATANEDEGPAVRTALRCEPDGPGTRVTLTSEVTGAFVAGATTSGVLDRLLFGRSQRRAARATLRRLRQLAEPS
jgi:Polyketide cyclase / dehydrase and lipid transport